MACNLKHIHEKLLMFLDDNISKLVKLKVASRIKYKEYQENYMNYLNAVSIQDEDLIELYDERTEVSRRRLRDKLLDAISENEELLDNPLVKEYLGLMFISRGEDGKNIDESYSHWFDYEESYYISDFVCFFSGNLSKDEEDDLDAKAREDLVKMVEDRVYNHVQDWIDDLPHNDLKVLKELVNEGRVAAPNTCQRLLVEKLYLIDRTIDMEHPEYVIYDDIKNAVAPYLDAAIEKKVKNNEGFLERLLMGLLNIVGYIEEAKAREIIKNLLPQSQIKFMPEDVDRFFDHSMILRYHRDPFLCQSDGSLLSSLIDAYEWDEDIRDGVEPFYPTDIEDVIAHGEYPFFRPYRAAEQAFYSMFVDTFGYQPIDASFRLTYYYSMLQKTDYTLKEMCREILEVNHISDFKQKNIILDVITDFNNGIPRFILKGNTPCDELNKLKKSLRNFKVMPGYTDGLLQMLDIADQKIGRNDQCPCGSGKKYKKCCGRDR